jgi:hypothetical protein
MFNLSNMQALLKARPFVPFRLVLSDGGTVEVKSPEVVLLGKQFAVVGMLDPNARDTLINRWTTVFYLHVSRAEQLTPGAPPLVPPQGPAESPTPSPA